MDTMTSTKVVASLCGALLVFLLGKWVAEELYHVGGHGEAAYVIDTGASDEPAEAEPEIDFTEVMASADAGKGANVFKKCQACHKLGAGENATGPTLHNVVGRDIAGVDGFGYSGALTEIEGVWDYDHLNRFLENPKGYAPGTAMGFAGLRKVEDRANVIAYLERVSD